MQYPDQHRMAEAIRYVEMANKHAFTYAHPAYRRAEELLRNLSTDDVTAVNTTTGGLKTVIGRGIKV